MYEDCVCCSGQGADSDEGGGGVGGRDRAESGGWIDLGRDEKLALVRLYLSLSLCIQRIIFRLVQFR